MTLATLCLQQCHLPADVTFIARADPEFGYRNGISLCLGHDLQESHCCCSWAVSLHIPSQFLQEVQEIQSVLCLCSEDSCIWPVRPQAGKSTSCNEPCMKSWELELPSFNVVPPQRPKILIRTVSCCSAPISLLPFLFQTSKWKELSGSTKDHEESPSKII